MERENIILMNMIILDWIIKDLDDMTYTSEMSSMKYFRNLCNSAKELKDFYRMEVKDILKKYMEE